MQNAIKQSCISFIGADVQKLQIKVVL